MTSQGRQYPDGLEGWPDNSLDFWPKAAGEFLFGAPDPQPGPPYVHTFASPEPIGQDDDGNDIYPEPGPAYTLTQRPIADVVAEAGFGPVPQRVEITADFCQCPACREARCEP